MLLFLGSTLTSYATVHACAGEITDISLFSTASCQHKMQEEEQTYCSKMKCCKSKPVEHNGEQTSKNCCETNELIALKSQLVLDAHTVQPIFPIALPSLAIFLLHLEVTEINTDHAVYVPPKRIRNIPIEIQVFRI